MLWKSDKCSTRSPNPGFTFLKMADVGKTKFFFSFGKLVIKGTATVDKTRRNFKYKVVQI
jgi:hypothetical protein